MGRGLMPPHSSGLENQKNPEGFEPLGPENQLVTRERSKQDPGLGDEPSCPNQFHAKESRANQPGFVVFWPAVSVCFRITANHINPRYGVPAAMRR
jgi:hypothetical protein